ncbi:hypothetical protein M011DRAFT_400416, partial [Sporormia fimetaria CBS 119925]
LSPRQATPPPCPSEGYTSKNGLQFETYCNEGFGLWYSELLGNRAPDAEVKDVEECMELCSRFGDEQGREACFGLVLSEGKNGWWDCYLKNSNTSLADRRPGFQYQVAFVVREDMAPVDSDCPAPDSSTQQIGDLSYTVHCGKTIPAEDVCWKGYASCGAPPYAGFYHAETLEECVQFCADEIPLCKAVVWDPTMKGGFANCWPKSDVPTTLDDSGSDMITHVATINMGTIDSSCPEESMYTAPGDQKFEIQCGKTNKGTSMSALHADSVTECMDGCAGEKKCTGVVFEPAMNRGYRNCHLHNSTNVVDDNSGAMYAALTEAGPPTNEEGSPTNDEGESNNTAEGDNASTTKPTTASQAWIAGAVVGPVFGVALVGFVVFWWRRRRNSEKAAYPHEMDSQEVYKYERPDVHEAAPPDPFELGTSKDASTYHVAEKYRAVSAERVHELPP